MRVTRKIYTGVAASFIFINRFSRDTLFSSLVYFAFFVCLFFGFFVFFFFFLPFSLCFEIENKYSDNTHLTMQAGEW